MNEWERPTHWARVVADAGLGVVFALALAVQAIAVATTWGGGYWLFGLVAGAIVCGIALLRRRDRAIAATAGLVISAIAIVVTRLAELPDEPGLPMALGLSVLIGSAIRALASRWMVAFALASFVIVIGNLFISPASSPVPTLNAATWGTGLAIGLGLRLLDERRAATIDKVRNEERLGLARELHDVVAHHVTGIIVQAQAAQIVARKHPDRLDDSLEGIAVAGSDALAAMRQVVGLLRDSDDSPSAMAGPEQLAELVERFEGAAVQLRLPGSEDGDDDHQVWPKEVTSTIYRVVRESLTNIARHAPRATEVIVEVARGNDVIAVEVSDNGPPIRPRGHQTGYGLLGMRERVEALGGTLTAGPRRDAGWSVRATLPFAGSDAGNIGGRVPEDVSSGRTPR